MNLKANFYGFMAVVVFLTCGWHPAAAQESKKFKVLAVFSYEDVFPWDIEIRKAVESVLSGSCEMKFFYMNTKTNPEGGEQKAGEAYALYQEFQPDGVIAVDDNAQAMFVVPYLKDRVKTPVMFCGVNAEPDKYGYPASNVSGILERSHIKETLSLLQLLVPSVKTVGYIARDSSTAAAESERIKKESASYEVKSVSFRVPKDMKEALAAAEELKQECDALLIMASLQGMPDKDGTPLTEKEIIPALGKAFGKPLAGVVENHVRQGALCTVVVTGHEQGVVAAGMLLKAMRGTPVSEIPITRNYQGNRMINVNTLKEMGISLRPDVIGSAQLVKSEN